MIHFKVQLEDEEGNKRNDCVISLSIDGSRRGTSIGAAAEGGSENVTAFNCQHLNYPTACNSMELTHTVAVLNCKETDPPVRQCVKIFEQQLAQRSNQINLILRRPYVFSNQI
jgi:hypothetical protein